MKMNISENEMRSQIEGKADKNFNEVDFLNVNMFVEAGAGAGKTTLIVKRIINQLKAGDEPGSFVVITFTKAAAGELRERIAAKVKEEGLTDVLAHLDEMNISTIHSFCNLLLSEQSILAGLPQNIEMMDETEGIAFQKKYFYDYMSTLTKKDWDRMEHWAKAGMSRWQIKNDLESLYKDIVDLPYDKKIITPRRVARLTVLENLMNNKVNISKAVLDAVLKAAQSLTRDDAKPSEKVVYNDIAEVWKDDGLASAELIRRLDDYFKAATDDEKADIVIESFYENNNKLFKANAKKHIYKKDQIKPVLEKLCQNIDTVLSDFKAEVPSLRNKEEGQTLTEFLKNPNKREKHYRLLVGYALRARNYYRENKQKNKITNNNLLEFTRDLICNPNDTRALEFFAKKYKHFYVDEFQDTDKLQESFIYRLASDLNDPEHKKLRDGALFIVGDPKQSIYRFRGAEPGVYFDVKERMSKDDMTNCYVYELKNNFRSCDAVINWVNEKFEDSDETFPIMDENHGYISMTPIKKAFDKPANSKKLLAGIYKYENCDCLYEKFSTDKKGNTKSKIEKCKGDTADDIKAVIRLILGLKNQGYKITRYSEKDFTPYEDDIKFSDFLLISENKGEMVEYLEALKSAGIPVWFDGRADVSLEKVLNAYVRIYWYLENPREPMRRVAAWEAVRETNITEDEIKLHEYTDNLLDYLNYECRGKSAYGKAMFLMNEMYALLDKNKSYSPVDIYSIKTRLTQMVETVLYSQTGTGVQIASAFEEYINTPLEHELSLEENPDAVRFMNLHKTKGLEGDIVIMLNRKGKRKKTPYIINTTDAFYPGIKMSWSSIDDVEPFVSDAIKEEWAEFHRLEYVAVTRAKQAVIFMNTLDTLGMFAYMEKDETKYNYKIDESPSIKVVVAAENVTALSVEGGDYKLPKEGGKSFKFGNSLYETINPSGCENHPLAKKNSERFAAIKEMGEAEYEKIAESFKRPANNIIGNIIHRTMELLADRFESGKSLGEYDALAAFCARQAFKENEGDINISKGEKPEEYLGFATKAAKGFCKYLLESGVLDGATIYTEMPFSYCEESGTEKKLHKGTADLILHYEKENRVCLIDYKSDNDFLVSEATMEEGFKHQYGPQVAEYQTVINSLMGVDKDKIEAKIVSFSLRDEDGVRFPGDEIRVRITNIS